MSQNWVANLYTTGTVVDTTMSNVELMFATLKSSFSGGGAPANSEAGVVWYDSNASYKCLQVRDSGDAAWRGIMAGSSACKVWLYLNAVEEGWTIAAELTADTVLGVKKTGGTYSSGAAEHGSWFISGINNESAHTHTGANHRHSCSSNVGGKFTNVDPSPGFYTDYQTGTTGAGSAHTHTQDGNWRIKAAVGIMGAPKARG